MFESVISGTFNRIDIYEYFISGIYLFKYFSQPSCILYNTMFD